MAAASLTMTASFLTNTNGISSSNQGTMIVKASSSNSNAAARPNIVNVSDVKKNDGNGKKELVFAAAEAAAVYSITNSGIAMVDDEPKRGTPEAKKKYGPVWHYYTHCPYLCQN